MGYRMNKGLISKIIKTMAKMKKPKRKRRKLRAVETVYKGGPKHVKAHKKQGTTKTQQTIHTKKN